MATKVTFETAALADCLKKAERVAPMKGAAFDQAAGIVLEVNADTKQVVVRATNLEIFYMEWIECLRVEGPSTTWRAPSRLLAGVVASLPIGSGKEVTLEDKLEANGIAKTLHLASGRSKARMNILSTDYYPHWSAFDPDKLTVATDLGGRIAQVEWAAAKSSGDVPFCGVHFSGEYLYSTDRFRMARAPLKVELGKPVTIPARLLSPIVKATGDVSVGTEGDQLLLMPDEHTQIRTVIYAMDYVPVDRAMRTEYTDAISFKKPEFLEMASRANLFTGADRFPSLRTFIGQEELAIMMQNVDVGLLGDVIELPGQAIHPRIELKFLPDNIVSAIENSPNDDITLRYNPAKLKGTVKIEGGSGYEAWIAPRVDNQMGETK